MSRRGNVHLIAVLGAPGTGKTHLVRSVLNQVTFAWQPFVYGCINGRLYSPYANTQLFVLGNEGTSEATFAGTDAWSLRTIRGFPAFWETLFAHHAPCTVLVEGSRVTYASFIEAAEARGVSVSLVELQASFDTIASRTLRNSYSAVWMRGMLTRLARICQLYASRLPYYMLKNENESHLQDNMHFIMQLLERENNGRS